MTQSDRLQEMARECAIKAHNAYQGATDLSGGVDAMAAVILTLLRRVELEGKIEIVNNLKGAERHEWWEMAERLKAQLAALDAEGKK